MTRHRALIERLALNCPVPVQVLTGEAPKYAAFRGARAALAWSTETASLARQHNNAQIVSIGARMHTADEAVAILEAFITTPWSEAARHQRRIDMLLSYEETGRFA